jgi:hypothetical protein
LAALLSGCVGSGPNTQRGAVGGAAVGALGGAIIGNNSGGHNGASGALIGGLLGALAGGTIGNSVDHQNGTVYRSEAEATTTYVVQQPPPPPPPPQVIVVREPPPAPDVIYVEGYQAYNGREYVWVPGRYERPPPRARQYVPPHWERRQRDSVYVEGYWH